MYIQRDFSDCCMEVQEINYSELSSTGCQSNESRKETTTRNRAMSYKTNKTFRHLLISASAILLTTISNAQAVESDVIINCKSDCSAIAEKVISLGGSITHKYQNFSALAVSMDENSHAELFKINASIEIAKDRLLSVPEPKDTINLSATEDIQVLQGEQLQQFNEAFPNGYEHSNLLGGAVDLNLAGHTGSGVIVAVIDSGTANNAAVVPALAGSVIGGENFVPGATEPSATSTLNGSHGTWVGTMIAGHTFFLFDSAGVLAQSLNTHMPDSILFDFFPGTSIVPMFGSAPDASLYAMKTFPAAGGGSPESRIIAAMDRAITMKNNYDNGDPSVPVNPGCGAEDNPCIYDSLNIQVVNMSLGGGTLYAGADLEDQITLSMLNAGITLVASAGNEGFAAITGGSPGTGRGSLTVGAASTVGNERVLRDIQFGLGFGELYRPSNHHQMATFSSRGPSADGRISTDVVAPGFANFMQGASGGLSLSSGTSFSAPFIAGIAADLRGAFPGASSVEIRNAIAHSANPNILGDNSNAVDQGYGFVDGVAAFNMLDAGAVDTSLPTPVANKFVIKNVEGVGLNVVKPRASVQSRRVSDLVPGQVRHVFIEVDEDTEAIQIDLTNIVAELPADQQNVFFGDDVFYVVQDAITHTEAPLASGFITSDTILSLANPQHGLLRLAVMGDWTNAGKISVDVGISKTFRETHPKSAVGAVAQDGLQSADFMIADGTTSVTFELGWKSNWAVWPTDDLDLILVDPSNNSLFDGATLNSPERVTINNPEAGVWTATIQGFTVHGINLGPDSDWNLRVTDQDGNVIPRID